MKTTKRRWLTVFAALGLAVSFTTVTETGSALAQTATRSRSRQSQPTVEYACPMHPEVRSKKSGRCPKCEMALRPVSAAKVASTAGGGNAGDAQAAPLSSEAALRIPDTPVLDQHGNALHFYSDLVKGKTVAINFIFTTCNGVCPTLAAKFRQMQLELGDRVGRDLQLISISVDPATDVPERLSAFAEKFHAGPGWTFVTGSKPEIDELLRALGAYAPDKDKHPQSILVGNDAAGYWTRTLGISPAKEMARLVRETAGVGSNTVKASLAVGDASSSGVAREASAKEVPNDDASGAGSSESYFPNLTLLTQENKPVHFYDDLLKGKVVLINFMFTTCKGVCSPMTANLSRVQQYLGDRVGRDINMISISVDPETDTVGVLKHYAETFKARPGWYFLTGKKENVNWVLYKLGGYVEDKSQHSSVLLIGNEVTGEWMKMPAMASPAEIASAAIKVADSRGN